MKEFLIRAKTIQEDVQGLVSAIHDHFDVHIKPLNIKFTDRRSLSANAQIHVWVKQISEQTGEDTRTIFARMKRDQGLPILLADPEHGPVADFILESTKFRQRRDDKQLIIVDAMEVTRKFSTSQHNKFRDDVQQFYNAHGFNLQYLEKEDEQS